MLEQIVHLAEAIVQPSETERPLLTALCAAAGAEIEGRLRDGISPEDCGDAFPCAAALLAAASILPCRSGGDVEQFSVGDRLRKGLQLVGESFSPSIYGYLSGTALFLWLVLLRLLISASNEPSRHACMHI